jgi:hypothetical protein
MVNWTSQSGLLRNPTSMFESDAFFDPTGYDRKLFDRVLFTVDEITGNNPYSVN